jgi:dolichol-phosphate mannosyltransferase
MSEVVKMQQPVCVLLPVLNEVTQIEPLEERIAAALAGRRFCICFVDDGSRDGTLNVLRGLADKHPRNIHLISRVKRIRGSQRGGALRAAMLWGLQQQFELFVEMDGDLSHRPEELSIGLEMIESGRCDVAIASKYLPGSLVLGRPAGRRAVSYFCNLAVRALLSRRIRDYSNGYRFYTRRAAECIAHTHVRYGSPIYLSEVMAIWLSAGFRIEEFISTYVGRDEGISKLRKRDLLKAAVAILEIAGRYRFVGFSAALPVDHVYAALSETKDAPYASR